MAGVLTKNLADYILFQKGLGLFVVWVFCREIDKVSTIRGLNGYSLGELVFIGRPPFLKSS